MRKFRPKVDTSGESGALCCFKWMLEEGLGMACHVDRVVVPLHLPPVSQQAKQWPTRRNSYFHTCASIVGRNVGNVGNVGNLGNVINMGIWVCVGGGSTHLLKIYSRRILHLVLRHHHRDWLKNVCSWGCPVVGTPVRLDWKHKYTTHLYELL